MSVFVDRAGSGRTKCEICGNAIAKTVARVVDETTYYVQEDERVRRKYCHLECAVEVKPEHARAALIARETDFDAVAAIVESGDAKLAAEIREFRDREYRKVPRRVVALDGPETAALIAQLEAAPQDLGLLAVLADHLQQQGDERGELIAIELARSVDPAAHTRRREIVKALSPDLGSQEMTWGVGFIRKLDVFVNESLVEHAAVLAHPSCRLVESVQVRSPQTKPHPIAIGDVLPKSVRTLILFSELAAAQPLASLSRLDSLTIWRSDDASHPTLRSLTLTGATPEDMAPAARSFPAVTSLALFRYPANCIGAVAKAGWFDRLRDFEVSQLNLDEEDVGRLERALDGKKLARLSIQHCYLGEEYKPRLAALCDELDFKYPHRAVQHGSGPVFVEHTNKPEWGRGQIVREADGKVDVEFASGKKTFKADAPFLKRITE